jgi:hypothetical protein
MFFLSWFIPPPIFFAILFRFFSSPKFRDAFYPWYSNFILKILGIKFFHSNQIIDLQKVYPEKIKIVGNGALLYSVIVFENGIIRISKNVFYIKDYYWYYLFFSHIRTYLGKIKTTKTLDKATFMVGSFSKTFNFFHFLTDSLLTNMSETMNVKQYVPIISDIKNTFQEELLDLMNIDDYLEISKGPIFCKELHIADYHNKFNSKKTKLIRKKLLNNGKVANKIVYISRLGNRRSFKNERDIQKFLQERGVEIVDFSNLNLKERQNLLSKTKVLIGQYGAGLTNMLFMPSGGYVIEIQIGNWVKEDYCTYSLLCGHKYLMLPLPIKLFSNYNHYNFTNDDFYRLDMLLGVVKNNCI